MFISCGSPVTLAFSATPMIMRDPKRRASAYNSQIIPNLDPGLSAPSTFTRHTLTMFEGRLLIRLTIIVRL